MANGNQAGETGKKIKAINRDDGNQYVVDDQHVFAADFEEKGPGKQQNEKSCKHRPVKMRQENALFFPVGCEKVSGCQPTILRQELHPLDFMYAEKSMRFEQ
jgi:hypothetical protein